MSKPFNVRLAAWRAKQGLTQEQCAEAVGVSVPSWSRYEAGLRNAGRPVRFLIAQLTGIGAEE